MSMWDVGAHIGYYVITAATLSPTGSHLAVEADPANVARLRHNLALNSIGAEVLEVAVSDKEQRPRFDAAGGHGCSRRSQLPLPGHRAPDHRQITYNPGTRRFRGRGGGSHRHEALAEARPAQR
ncbi:MAG: FkbM family methyltransferase [Acidimicrobiales bacterium]